MVFKKFLDLFFCILIPVVGYIIVLMNLDKLEEENEGGHSEKIYYLTIATIGAAFWIFKLVPHQLQIHISLLLFTLYIGYFIINKFRI